MTPHSSPRLCSSGSPLTKTSATPSKSHHPRTRRTRRGQGNKKQKTDQENFDPRNKPNGNGNKHSCIAGKPGLNSRDDEGSIGADSFKDTTKVNKQYVGRSIVRWWVWVLVVHEKVTDYRTFVSGVKHGDLTGPNAMDFGVCRKKVIELLRNNVLVGHAVHNDLNIMKIIHPLEDVRDTSMYEPFMVVDHYTGYLRPQKLKNLSKVYLGRTIQEEGTCHDSCIDAQTALDLYKSVQTDWESAVSQAQTHYAAFGPPFGRYQYQGSYN
ncbi:Interferon-stimulated 20 kDa exonuclease-like 2 [Seminavis robusta]|uniref:Interferon-stimulated 20 kDa exonuclease-like 2 n=1 Tax=Seminavis robusta TaxID=568900 RepID=A0A9N8E092_9STRA|nr:Interferon-stimulated 20 kDa exonuclease-like 2 [Seminavis robusta]|eukprot:Sro495_g154550.1 Interferon-stimulated 20 kDa exonuclease-like 2 (267) ;mRNA; f:61349-62223